MELNACVHFTWTGMDQMPAVVPQDCWNHQTTNPLDRRRLMIVCSGVDRESMIKRHKRRECNVDYP